MTKWYVWECCGCDSILTINYEADYSDYMRIKNCGCGKGEYEYSHEYEGDAE